MQSGDFAVSDIEDNLYRMTTDDAVIDQTSQRIGCVDHYGVGFPAMRARDILFYDTIHAVSCDCDPVPACNQ